MGRRQMQSVQLLLGKRSVILAIGSSSSVILALDRDLQGLYTPVASKGYGLETIDSSFVAAETQDSTPYELRLAR